MYEACHQGEYLRLRRTIRLCHNAPVIHIEDTLQNLGSLPQPFMLLYHVNFGAPFLRPGTKVTLPSGHTTGFDTAARENLHRCGIAGDVSEKREDLLWLHTPSPAPVQTASVDNGDQKVTLAYSGDTLPVLAQWELLAPRDYVLALEPTNTHLNGQVWERENGSLQQIQPGEQVCTTLELIFE